MVLHFADGSVGIADLGDDLIVPAWPADEWTGGASPSSAATDACADCPIGQSRHRLTGTTDPRLIACVFERVRCGKVGRSAPTAAYPEDGWVGGHENGMVSSPIESTIQTFRPSNWVTTCSRRRTSLSARRSLWSGTKRRSSSDLTGKFFSSPSKPVRAKAARKRLPDPRRTRVRHEASACAPGPSAAAACVFERAVRHVSASGCRFASASTDVGADDSG